MQSTHTSHRFRGIKTAAPLKLRPTERARYEEWLFPRYQNRGPIEAAMTAATAGDGEMFPRYQNRGPIEASNPGCPGSPVIRVSAVSKPRPH